ncbi:hypothetical protein B0H63DRAFT_269661 [Podospora didyma]|uniref:Nonsense-mediated mRNA decay factor n=1 Tax=Podospora didyma TaxID=330526 RepID=A0AAE0KE67_9PEZI|nr:hypothetical protein B0H63DRAFT_269661 [Podospora didyma]
MEKYRLACIQTVWFDIRAATEKNAEDALWNTHSAVTRVYRKILEGLRNRDQVVLRRKIEKNYLNYLTVSQYFYKGYLQRVCARYDIKDLNRVARRAKLEDMPLPDDQKVDAAAANLEGLVTESCHKLLVCLGDLARYRTHLRSPKDQRWDTALMYYALANELVPESGYGHHQCGVIYLEIKNHLEVVYHLYRAMACDTPHPNASTNLEREFREVRGKKTAGAQGVNGALLSWFVKLHAFYYQGDEFTERKELEDEVDHRMAVAVKATTQTDVDMDLLKMVLINITAYVVGKDKIQVGWTETKSRSCQYILLMNIRTIHTLSRILREEIVYIVQGSTEASTGAEYQRCSLSKFTPVFSRVLPLLRAYMTWLCSYGHDLVEYQAHLEPQFGNMCRNLSQVLTLLFELLGKQKDLANTVPFRLPEDDETLGLKCLNGADVGEGCQLSVDPISYKPKPRAEDIPGATFTADDAAITRVMGIIVCALHLAQEDLKFPLVVNQTAQAVNAATFQFLEGGKRGQVAQVPAPQNIYTSGLDAQAAAPPTITNSLKSNPREILKMPASLSDSEEFSEDEEFIPTHAGGHEAGSAAIGVPASRSVNGTSQIAPTSEFSVDRMLYQILNDFLTPPENGPIAAPSETMAPPVRSGGSYNGMGSTTAGAGFGAPASISPKPGSATVKTFKTLPWEYFYTPAPVDAGLRTSVTGSASGGWGLDGSESSRPVSSGSAALRQEVTTPDDQFTLRSEAQVRSLYDNGPEQHQSLHQSVGSSDRFHEQMQNHNLRGIWPEVGETSAPHTRKPSNHSPSASWNNYRASNGSNQWLQSSGARPSTNSPFSSSMAFSATSTLPPVNSPRDLPANAFGNAYSAEHMAKTYSQPSSSAFSSHLTGPPNLSLPSRSRGGGVAAGNGKMHDPTAYARMQPSPAEYAGQYEVGHQYAIGQPAAATFASLQADEYSKQTLMNAWIDGNNPQPPVSATPLVPLLEVRQHNQDLASIEAHRHYLSKR